MFDKKEEDDGVADNGESPHNHQKNKTGEVNLWRIQETFLFIVIGIFTVLTHWGMSGETR